MVYSYDSGNIVSIKPCLLRTLGKFDIADKARRYRMVLLSVRCLAYDAIR